MILLNTIAGDIIGSKYEFSNIHSKEFELFQDDMHYTDDTVLTIATIDALLEINKRYTEESYELEKDIDEKLISIFKEKYYEYGNKYNNINLAYGANFLKWLSFQYKKAYPYNSFGNGSAMRASPIAWYSKTLKEARLLAKCSAFVTHNHTLGIKGAVDITESIFKLLNYNVDKDDIIKECKYIVPSNISKVLFDETCEGTIPYAYKCFVDSESTEDAIRNAISCGGDSDTLGIITASLAEAYYPEDEEISKNVLRYLEKEFILKINEFNNVVAKR